MNSYDIWIHMSYKFICRKNSLPLTACVSNFKWEHYEHTKVHVPFRNWVWILLGLLGMITDQWRPPVRPSYATTNAVSPTTAETKTKTSNETEEKLAYYILFDCSPSDERARTMTMYFLPSPEIVVTARDGISSSAFAAPHLAPIVKKCFWRLILLVFCA